MTVARTTATKQPGRIAKAVSVLLGRRDETPDALVAAIEKLVEADQVFESVAPTVNALLRASLVADPVADAFAGRPNIIDDAAEWLSADDVLRIARVRGQAEAAILRQPMLRSSDLAAVLGSKATNPRDFARALRQRSDVVALPRQGGFLIPAFQVDRGRSEIWPIVVEINRLLGASDDPWAVASWWCSPDPHLGQPPAELVAEADRADELRMAARRELAPIG